MGRWLDGGEELREGEAVGEEFDFVGVGLVDGDAAEVVVDGDEDGVALGGEVDGADLGI